MTTAADRRRTIRVQDLLCKNALQLSSCHSPSDTTDHTHTTAALSSPALSYAHYTRNHSTGSSFDPDTPSSSELDLWNHPTADNLPQHLAEQPAQTAPQPFETPTASRNTTDHSDHRQKAIRGPWRIEEDRLLIDLVQKYGPRHWSAIATHFPRRSGKQARERWMNQLNPELKKKNWTADEDRIILRAHASLGNKWSAIANLLPGRTDNSVKNRFNSTLKRAMKERALTTQSLNIDEFVQALHAKPYILGQEFLLAADHAVTNGVNKQAASPQAVNGQVQLDQYGMPGADLDGANYLSLTAGADDAQWAGSAPVVNQVPDMRTREEQPMFTYGYLGSSAGQSTCSSEDPHGVGSLMGDQGPFDYREGSSALCGMSGNGRGEIGWTGPVVARPNAMAGTAPSIGQAKDEFCPIRDSLGGRREVSPAKTISKRRR